jgi:alpha-tubulin suppressor-like RCC1 family protein
VNRALHFTGSSKNLCLRSGFAPLLTVLLVLGCGDGGPEKVRVIAIDSHSGYHTCALLSDGSVKCWGQNDKGQLGDGTSHHSSTPVEVKGLADVTAVSAGTQHTCALLSSGLVKCWGDNFDGELGDGTTTNASTPVAVKGLSGATAISASDNFTCAILAGGLVKCWGYNGWAQLGSQTTDEDSGGAACSTTPVPVSGVEGATGLATGGSHVCAIFPGGTARCWGANNNGQLGDGVLGTETGSTVTGSPTPMSVVGLTGALTLAANGANTCALLSDGTVRCWGANLNNVLGAGAVSGLTPVTIQDIKGAVVLAGGGAMCVVLSDGTPRCWGRNEHGQLGNGTTKSSDSPLAVPGLSDVVKIAAGERHTCALLSDHTVRCWGDNLVGELGDGAALGNTISPPSPPVTVVGL